MAGVEKFKVTVTGVSSHAARPDLGVDTVTAVTTMVQNLQLLISRTVSPFGNSCFVHYAPGCGFNLECTPKIRLF